MNSTVENSSTLDQKIIENIEEIEREKEEKLLNLIAEVIIKKTLKEFYEEGN